MSEYLGTYGRALHITFIFLTEHMTSKEVSDYGTREVRGFELPDGQPLSAVFLTNNMTSEEVRPVFVNPGTICYRCGEIIVGSINYQHVGGHGDEPYCLACFAEQPGGE